MLSTKAIIILVTFSLASSIVIDRCSQWYISSEGNNCTYCPPGTYRYMDCNRNGESAICKGCGYDSYQTYCNQALSCAPCSQVCPWRFSVITEACTMYTDVKCMCEQGKYLFKETFEDGVCLNHSQCAKGYGLLEPGTPWSDRVCESCIKGKTFSEVSSLQHCRPCTLCAAFRRSCSTTQNAECEDKQTSDNPDNRLNKIANNNDIIIKAVVSSVGTVLFIAIVFAMACYCRKRLQNCRDANRNTPEGEKTNGCPVNTQNVCSPPGAATVQPIVGYTLNNTGEVKMSEGASNKGFADDATEQEHSTHATEHDYGQAMGEPLTEREQLFEVTAIDKQSPDGTRANKDSNQTVGERKRTKDSPSATHLDNINITAGEAVINMEPHKDTRDPDTTNENGIQVNPNLIAQETGQATKVLAQCLDEDIILKLTNDSNGDNQFAKFNTDLSDFNTPDNLSSDESVRLHATETNDSLVLDKCSDLSDLNTSNNSSSIKSVRLHAMETDESGAFQNNAQQMCDLKQSHGIDNMEFYV